MNCYSLHPLEESRPHDLVLCVREEMLILLSHLIFSFPSLSLSLISSNGMTRFSSDIYFFRFDTWKDFEWPDVSWTQFAMFSKMIYAFPRRDFSHNSISNLEFQGFTLHISIVYDICTDISKITRKPSKTSKHGHEERKSTKEARDAKPKAGKVKKTKLWSTWVNKVKSLEDKTPKYFKSTLQVSKVTY
ncbi:hypothetical protein Tco_1266536 [Tanacetum coccineum]